MSNINVFEFKMTVKNIQSLLLQKINMHNLLPCNGTLNTKIVSNKNSNILLIKLIGFFTYTGSQSLCDDYSEKMQIV